MSRSDAKAQKPAGKVEDITEIAGRKVSKNVYLCADGVYRWYYEYKMLKNPTIFLTVLKVLGMSAAIVAALVAIFSLKDWINYGFQLEAGSGKVLLIVIAVFLGITVLSYIILAALYGWKYLVLFEMDDTRIVHIQMPRQVKKAETVGLLTALVGAASHNPMVVGVGYNAASKTESTSEWSRVTKIKCRKKMQTIYVNSRLDHNQIYVDPEDFDFVKDFIVSHCTNAKIK